MTWHNDEIESLKAQLKQAQLKYQMEVQVNEFRAGFLARTAHELRAPLNGLIGLHQLILSDLCESPEEEKEFLSQANDSALKMVKLMDEIIHVSKAEYGSNPLDIQAIKLEEVLQEVHRLTTMQARNRSIRLQIETSDPSIYVMADFSKLRQILLHLVDSSIALMKEGSLKVETQVDSNAETVQIRICIQSPHQVWSEPVDLLEQESAPDTPNRESLPPTPRLSPGMKLLISQQLLEMMGGSLEVIPLASDNDDEETITQLQCSLPLAQPETLESD